MRGLLVAIVSLLLVSFAPSAAQSPVAHVALLGALPVLDPSERPAWQAFIEALQERGWVEGHNLAFELRWAGGRAERYPELAAELVALRPDLFHLNPNIKPAE